MSDKLDPALSALLEAERSAPIVGAAEAKAQILAKVLASAGSGAATGGAAAASGAAWSTKALLLVALSTGLVGAVLGSIVTTALTEPANEAAPANPVPDGFLPDETIHVEDEDAVDDADEVPSEREESPPELGVEASSSGVARMRVLAEEEPEDEVEVVPEPSTLAAERALIDQALSALRAQRAQNALLALMSHERRFPNGALSEERDRLSVDALVQLGRSEQARRRARLFETRYPGSAHLPRVRSLVESTLE